MLYSAQEQINVSLLIVRVSGTTYLSQGNYSSATSKIRSKTNDFFCTACLVIWFSILQQAYFFCLRLGSHKVALSIFFPYQMHCFSARIAKVQANGMHGSGRLCRCFLTQTAGPAAVKQLVGQVNHASTGSSRAATSPAVSLTIWFISCNNHVPSISNEG